MTGQLPLIAAIRAGRLSKVKAALDAGAPLELDDGHGEPGLPMGIACFMGFVEIVRELVSRGAKVNLPDNSVPTSPLNMAIRGGKTDVVRLLVELGANVPSGMKTGLTEQELIVALWVARRNGLGGGDVPPEGHHDVEEIEMMRCAGTDTQVLEAEALRAAANMR